MYVKIAYRMYDQHGYRFFNPEKYYGVTVHTNIERDSGRHKDERICRIAARFEGGAYLYNPTFEIGPDHIVVRGYACFNQIEKPPEGVHAPVASIMQEWILKVNVESSEEKEYDKAMKEFDVKEKKWTHSR